jgi:mannitol operon transcriptional antiterminator
MLERETGGGENSHDAADRPLLVLLYLIANPGWCKISELAHVLFLSDSSISTALAQLHDYLPEAASLERHKGVGVRITGDELTLRLGFVGVFTRLFPLYVSDGEEGSHRLLRALRLGDAAHLILGGISAVERILHYRLSPGYAGMLFSYIYLLRRRIPEGQMLSTGPKRSISAQNVLVRAAREVENLALRDGIAGSLPAVEEQILADVIGACDPMDSPMMMPADILGELEKPVEEVIERVLAEMEARDHVWLHDDSRLLNYLRLTLAAVTRRIHLFLPWDAMWLPSVPTARECGEKDSAQYLLQEYQRAFFHVLERWPSGFGAPEDVLCRQLQEPYLAIEARLAAVHRRRTAGLSVKILCYEGLGMSAWLGALVEGILPSGATVDTRWENPVAGAPWDLVVATYSVDLGDVPCIVIDTDHTPEQIKAQIEEAVHKILPSAAGAAFVGAAGDASDASDAGDADAAGVERVSRADGGGGEGERGASRLSLSVVMSVVRTFFVESIPPDAEIIDAVVAALDRGDCDIEILRSDFVRRESYGSLVFEDIGVRLIHCRSNGIPEPRAGVLRSSAHGVILVLAAPRTAPPEQTGALSEIVVALTEDNGFARVLADGTTDEVQERLIELFSRLLS